MPEKYLNEIQGKSSVKLYCFTLDTPPESRVLLGSGEDTRLRGGTPSAPRRKLLGSEEKIALFIY